MELKEKSESILSENETSFVQTTNTLNHYVGNLNGKLITVATTETNFTAYLPKDRLKNEAYIGSLISQYIVYAIDEMVSRAGTFTRFFLQLLKWKCSFVFRGLQLDKTIHVEANLLSTSIPKSDDRKEYWDALLQLKLAYPSHAIVIRGMNNYQHETLIGELEQYGFRKMVNRKVYLQDFTMRGFPKKRPLEQDVKRWNKQSELSWRKLDEQNKEELSRVLQLYQQVYREKHSQLNPDYRLDFLKEMLVQNKLSGEVLVDSTDYVLGVQLYLYTEGTLTTPFIGYDTTLPRSMRLYPFLNVRLMEHALRLKCVLNMSSGAGVFKRQRGGTGEFEYLVYYIDHLKWYRKIPWLMLNYGIERFAQPYLEQTDV